MGIVDAPANEKQQKLLACAQPTNIRRLTANEEDEIEYEV